MKPGFRQAMTWLHNWTGLVLGWPLLAMCAAGTLAVFREAIDGWAHPELPRGAVDQVAAGSAAVDWLQAHHPKSPAWFLQLADDRLPGTMATYRDGTGFVSRLLSPLTGSPEGIRDSLGGEFYYRFHFDLQLPYPFGRLIAVCAAFVLLTTLLTGIVSHRRIFKDFFTLRTGKGQRSWLDAHVALGVLALPFHLMIAFTGIVTLAQLALPWGGIAAYRGDTAALSRDLFPEIERPVTGRPAPLAPVAPMLRVAQARFGPSGIERVAIENPGDAAAMVTVSSGEAHGVAIPRRTLAFDGATGRVLGETSDDRPAFAFVRVLYGLHMAQFAGIATRWLYFLSGLMLTAAVGAGLILWTRKPRREQGFGFRLVERLNIGFVGGMPAAFAMLLLANRLLPVDLAGRAGLEVRWLFATWGAALLFAAFRAPARAWGEMLAAAALACGATVAADLATVARGGAAFDLVTIGVDGTLLVFATLFGGASVRLWRRAATVVPRLATA